MKQSTVLRIAGALVLLVMLAVIGTYNFSGPILLVVLVGFAFGWEKFIVKPAIKNEATDK